jgi:hypothetical protein
VITDIQTEAFKGLGTLKQRNRERMEYIMHINILVFVINVPFSSKSSASWQAPILAATLRGESPQPLDIFTMEPFFKSSSAISVCLCETAV